MCRRPDHVNVHDANSKLISCFQLAGTGKWLQIHAGGRAGKLQTQKNIYIKTTTVVSCRAHGHVRAIAEHYLIRNTFQWLRLHPIVFSNSHTLISCSRGSLAIYHQSAITDLTAVVAYPKEFINSLEPSGMHLISRN